MTDRTVSDRYDYTPTTSDIYNSNSNHPNNHHARRQRQRNTDGDSELPGLPRNNEITTIQNNRDGTTTIVEHYGSSSNEITTTTTSPLLFLLDGVLSRDEIRVTEAMTIIMKLYKVNIRRYVHQPPLPHHHHHHHHRNWQEHASTPSSTIGISNMTTTNIDDSNATTYPTESFSSTISSPPNAAGIPAVTNTTEYGIESPCTSSISLLIVINALLDQYPHLAQIASDHDGSLPLHFAASLGIVPVAHSILQKCTQAATTPNRKGKIPLHYAAREGRIEMVKYFLRECPQTCTIATDKGKLAVHFAAGDGHTEITSTLLQAYPESAAVPSHKGKLPLHFCARWGYMDIAYELVSIYPQSVQSLDWEGSLPLHDAAREGQYSMAKYLMNQYPQSLQIMNIRNEIPLFPAVRSNNVDLIVLMIQSWPNSGKHVLQNVRIDDNIASWDWDVIELLLRGATNHLYYNDYNNVSHSLLRNREPPTFRLYDDIQPALLESMSVTAAERKKEYKRARKAGTAIVASKVPPVLQLEHHHQQQLAQTSSLTYASIPNVSSRLVQSSNSSNHIVMQQRFVTVPQLPPPPPPPAKLNQYPILIPIVVGGWNSSVRQYSVHNECITTATVTATATPKRSTETESTTTSIRCKSPILEGSDEKQKMITKRSRKVMLGMTSDMIDDQNPNRHYGGLLQQRQRTFNPIHAVFECKASCYVVERTLQECPTEVSGTDDIGRNTLHYAVTHCTDSNIVDLVLHPKWNIITLNHVRQIDPITGLLPLHIAIMNNANVRIIQVLLQEYPSSGIEPCPNDTPITNPVSVQNDGLRNIDIYTKVEQSPQFQWTPIHLATHYNCDLSTVFVLLRNDPSFVIKNQW